MRLVALAWLILLANSVYLPVVLGPSGPGGQTIPTATSTPIPPTATPTATSTPAPTATATMQPPVCNCSFDEYNCSDFDTQPQAQACFDYCRSAGAGDVHQLDTDDDLLACESLPPLWRVLN